MESTEWTGYVDNFARASGTPTRRSPELTCIILYGGTSALQCKIISSLWLLRSKLAWNTGDFLGTLHDCFVGIHTLNPEP